VAVGIHRALEPVRHVVGVREAGSLRRLRRCLASLAAAADEIDVVLLGESRLPELIGEGGVMLCSATIRMVGSDNQDG